VVARVGAACRPGAFECAGAKEVPDTTSFDCPYTADQPPACASGIEIESMKLSRRCLCCLLAVAQLPFCVAVAGESAPSSRQEDVARKGADVMPFDLRRTMHHFDDTPTGGIETVTANESGDAEQVRLIRAHLSHEAARFAKGDFSDPGRIHGQDMPGLATLAAAGPALRVAYRSVPSGASVTYSSADRRVVAAIHEWFAAQRADHDAHAHMHH
jgi:hypothetical protein